MTRYIGIPCGIRMYMRDDETPADDAMHYPHTHDCCELYLFLRGKCTYMVENGIFPLSFGSVLYTRPGELHSVRVTEPCLYSDTAGCTFVSASVSAPMFYRPSLRSG